jgi:hypothetical protein
MRSPIAALVPALVLLAAAAPARAADPLAAQRGDPVADPATATTIYLPTAVETSGPSFAQALWRSDDAGATFRQVLVGAPFAWHEEFLPPPTPAVAVAPDGQLLVALRDGTVRRSSDGGASWASAPGLGFVSALAFGPAAPASAVFAVVSHPPAPVEDGRRLADEGDGVFRLEGDRWRRVLSGVVWQVVPHPADPSRVYATGPDAVYRSVDGGATFERVAAQVLYWVVVDGTRPDRLLGVDNDETLVRSDDAGSTWTHAAAPFEDAQGLSQPVAGAPHRVLVALDDNDEDDPSVVASDDFGATWRGLPPTGRTSFVLLSVSPADPDRIYGRTVNFTGAEAIATSADAGTSWSAHGMPLDGLGPRVSLTAPTISLLRTAGGVERPRARIPLRLAQEERALVEGEVRLVARLGGRDATIGSGEFESEGHHTFTASVRIGPRTAARLRAAGQVRGLLRISATDDVGETRVRWERLTIDARQAGAGSASRAASSASTASSHAP